MKFLSTNDGWQHLGLGANILFAFNFPTENKKNFQNQYQVPLIDFDVSSIEIWYLRKDFTVKGQSNNFQKMMLTVFL